MNDLTVLNQLPVVEKKSYYFNQTNVWSKGRLMTLGLIEKSA